MEKENLTLYQKLHKIQESVMGLKKDKKGNNYEYVTGTKVLAHIKPLMNEHGLILKQEVVSIENERMDYKTGIGTQYEKPKSEILSKVMMKFTWVDVDTGEKDENMFGANGQNDWDKGVGSAITYGERYFLLKYFHVATDEDDIDNPDRKSNDSEPPKQPVKTSEPSTDEKVANLVKKADAITPEELEAEKKKIFAITQAPNLTGYYNALTEDIKANPQIIGWLKERREQLKKPQK